MTRRDSPPMDGKPKRVRGDGDRVVIYQIRCVLTDRSGWPGPTPGILVSSEVQPTVV